MSEFESTRMKALKLAALAAGGEGGEAENARRMLHALLRRHGLTVDALRPKERATHYLDVIVKKKWWKPCKDKVLAALAVQCLRFVCGTDQMNVQVRVCSIEVRTRGLKVKTAPIYELSAEVTDAEFEDWRACFDHYAPSLAETLADLRQAQRRAAKALKMGLPAFLAEHEIFPPDAKKSQRRLSQDEILAAFAAQQSVKGETWRRPAGRLEQADFFLRE